MKYSFVTFLGTDSFLPGVIALHNSLKKYNKTYPLLVLTTDLVSTGSIKQLTAANIQHKHVDRISNPNKLENDHRNFRHTYTKLRIFELEEFDKLIFIDADMLVCDNIEDLFERPHMAAVIAGALNPDCTEWKDLNSGFMVIVPDKALALEMYAKVADMASNDGSDQGFLHSFYPDWPNEKALHLEHRYNVPVSDLDIYTRLGYFKFSYKNGVLDTDIAILHYWGYDKPWQHDGRLISPRSPQLKDHACLLWWDAYKPGQRKTRLLYYAVNAVYRKVLKVFKRG